MIWEKSTPHCKLSVVKILIEAGKVRATASAFQGAREPGINDLAGMCAVVMSLTVIDFYKSMTTHADYRIWQDVYRANTASSADVYLKLTVIDDVLIVSFNLETAVGCARVCRDWRARQGATTQWASCSQGGACRLVSGEPIRVRHGASSAVQSGA